MIFDLGGTLCARLSTSYEQLNAQALLLWLTSRGIQVDAGFVPALIDARERIFATRGDSGREVSAREAFQPIMHRYNLPNDREILAEAEAAFFAPELEAMEPLSGAVELLRDLRSFGIMVGLASNSCSHYFVRECCRRLQFAPHLDPIVTSALVGWAKPDARIFNAILTRWSLPPSAVVMVGDTAEADILGAHRLGMRSILLTAQHDIPDIFRRHAASAEDCPADASADSLAAVGQLIERWVDLP